jgi:hypothetical protein
MRLLRSRFQANDAFIQAVALYDSTLVSGAIKKMIDAAGVPLRPVPEGDENAKTNIESKEDELNEEDKIDIPALLPAVTETIAV